MQKSSSKAHRALGPKTAGFKTAVMWVLVLLTAFALSACSDDADRTLSGRVSLGAVMQSTVSLYKGDALDFSKPLGAQEHLLLDSVITKDDGSFVNIKVGKYSGPMLLAVKAKEGSRYFDESANDVLEIPQENLLSNDIFPDAASGGYVLFAMLPGPMESVGITSLTTAATALAAGENKRGVSSEPPGQTGGGGQNGAEPGLTKSAVEHTNERVREALAPKIDSILSEPDVVDEFTTANDLSADEGGRYAAILAALAGVGAEAGGDLGPALAFIQALVTDLMDGQIHGGDIYANFEAFIHQFIQALIAMVERYGNLLLQADIEDGYEPTQLAENEGGGGNGDTGPDYKLSGFTCQDVIDGRTDGICGTVDGKSVGSYVRYSVLENITYHSQGGQRPSIFKEHVKDSVLWSLAAKMDQASGTVTCEDADTEFTVRNDPRNPDEDGWQADTGNFKATSCEIHYTRVGNVVRGTFSATFTEGYAFGMWLDPDSEIPPFEITNGQFYATDLYRGDESMEGSYTLTYSIEDEVESQTLAPISDVLFSTYWPGEYAVFHGIADPDDIFLLHWGVLIPNLNAPPSDWTCYYSYFGQNQACVLDMQVHADHWAGTLRSTVSEPENSFVESGEADLTFKVYLPNGPVGARFEKDHFTR